MSWGKFEPMDVFNTPYSWKIQLLIVFYDQFLSYERARRLRVAVIHGMARMAALMASTYKAYLGVGLGPLSVGPVNCGIYW